MNTSATPSSNDEAGYYADWYQLKVLEDEHRGLLALAAKVVRAYTPGTGEFCEVKDDDLAEALDDLHGWVAGHHPDWQG